MNCSGIICTTSFQAYLLLSTGINNLQTVIMGVLEFRALMLLMLRGLELKSR